MSHFDYDVIILYDVIITLSWRYHYVKGENNRWLIREKDSEFDTTIMDLKWISKTDSEFMVYSRKIRETGNKFVVNSRQK